MSGSMFSHVFIDIVTAEYWFSNVFINISLVFFLGCLLGLVWYHFGAFGGSSWLPFGACWKLWGAPMEPFGVHLAAQRSYLGVQGWHLGA